MSDNDDLKATEEELSHEDSETNLDAEERDATDRELSNEDSEANRESDELKAARDLISRLTEDNRALSAQNEALKAANYDLLIQSGSEDRQDAIEDGKREPTIDELLHG